MISDAASQRLVSACGWFLLCIVLLLSRLWAMWGVPLIGNALYTIAEKISDPLVWFFLSITLVVGGQLGGTILLFVITHRLHKRLKGMWPSLIVSRLIAMLL